MPSKQYTYDVRIRASLDNSKLSGAGSSVSKQLDDELTGIQAQGQSKREQQAKASLNNLQAVETELYKGRTKADEAYYSGVEKRNAASLASLEKSIQAHYSNRTAQFNQAAKDEQKIVDQQLAYKIKAAKDETAAIQRQQDQAYKLQESNQKRLDKLNGASNPNSAAFQRQVDSGAFNKLDPKTLDGLRAQNAEMDALLAQQGEGGASMFWGSFKGAFIGILTGIMIGTVLRGVRELMSLVQSAIVEGMNFEKQIIALNSVSNSAAETAQQVTYLDQASRNTPGLSFDTAIEGEKRLRAVGFSAQQATEQITGLAKLRIMSGGSKEDLAAVENIYERIDTLGKVTDRDIRQLVSAMPAYGDVIRKVFGTSSSKMLKDLNLSSGEFFDLVQKEIAALPQPAGGAADALEKLGDSGARAAHAFVGFKSDGTLMDDSLLENTTKFLNKLTVAIDDNAETFRGWGTAIGHVGELLSDLTNSRNLAVLMQLGKVLLTLNPIGAAAGVLSNTADFSHNLKNNAQHGSTLSLLAYASMFGILSGSGDKKSTGAGGPNYTAADLGSLSQADAIKTADELRDQSYAKRIAASEAYWKQEADLAEGGYGQQQAIAKAATQTRLNITRSEFNFEIEELIEAGKDASQVSQDKETFLTLIARQGAAERAKIHKEETKAVLEELDKQVELDYQSSVAGERGFLSNAPTDTPGRASDVSKRTYAQQLKDIQDARTNAFRKESTQISLHTIDGGIMPEVLSQIEAEYKDTLTALDTQTKTLTAARANTVKAEAKSAMETYKYGQRLSISTGFADWDAIVRSTSSSAGINPNILSAITNYETRGMTTQAQRLNALSPKGARGPFQELTGPGEFASLYGVTDPNNFADAAGGAARWIKQALDYYADQPDALALVISGYNGGTSLPKGAKAKAQQIARLHRLMSSNPENSDYVKNVVAKIKGGANVDTSISLGNVDLGSQSDALTSSYSDKQVLDTIAYYKSRGITPDESLMSAYFQIQNKRQRTAGERQLTAGEMSNEFGFGSMTITPGLRAAGWDESTADRFAALHRRTSGFGRELKNARLNQDVDKGNQNLDLDKELFLIKSLNVEEESNLAIKARRNTNAKASVDLAAREVGFQTEISQAIEKQAYDTRNGILDTQRDLAVLADKSLVDGRRKLSALQEELGLRQEITKNQDIVANGDVNQGLYIQNELLKKQIDIRHEIRDAIVTAKNAETDINNMLQVRSTVIYADVLDQLSKQSNMEKTIADGIVGLYHGVVDPIDKLIDKGTAKLGAVGSFFGGIAKTAEHSLFTNFTKNIMDKLGLGNLANGSIDNATNDSNPVVAGLKKQDRQIDLLEKIEHNTNPGGFGLGAGGSAKGGGGGGLFGLLRGMFGGGGGGSTPGFNGSAIPAGFGGGSDTQGTFGDPLNVFGDSGPGGISQIGQVMSGNKGGIAGLLSGLFGGAGAGGGKMFGPGAIGGMLAMLPGIGIGLGSSLGGGSGLGSILGGLGGLAGAVALGGIFSTGSISTLAAVLGGTGVLAPIAGALLVGAILLGKKAQRDKDEKSRTQFLGDASSQIESLIAEVKGRRMSGSSALAQAATIKSNYIAQATALKDSKTRRIALNELNQPNKLWYEFDQLNKAAAQADSDDDRSKRIIPEFATGRSIGVLDLVNFRRRNGKLSGNPAWGDSLPSLLKPGEIVLNDDQQNRVRQVAGYDVFRQAQIPGYSAGVATTPGGSSESGQMSGPQITVYVSNEIDIDGRIKTVVKSDEIANHNIKVVNRGLKDRTVTVPSRSVV